MAWFSRALCVLSVLLLLLVGARIWPNAFRSLGLDVGSLSTQLQRLHHQAAHGQELDATRIRMLRKIAAKQQVAAELAARRLTLLQAVVRFHNLRDQTDPWELVLAHLPGDSKAERLCRYVIGYAAAALENRPEEARQLVERLEAELKVYLATHGSVSLR